MRKPWASGFSAWLEALWPVTTRATTAHPIHVIARERVMESPLGSWTARVSKWDRLLDIEGQIQQPSFPLQLQRHRTAGFEIADAASQLVERVNLRVVHRTDHVAWQERDLASCAGRLGRHDDAVRIAKAGIRVDGSRVDLDAQNPELRHEILLDVSQIRNRVESALHLHRRDAERYAAGAAKDDELHRVGRFAKPEVVIHSRKVFGRIAVDRHQDVADLQTGGF